MYSGIFILGEAFGVVGEDSVEEGWTSNAVWNDNIEAAVPGVAALGSGATAVDSVVTSAGPSLPSCTRVSLKGFFTSLATLITTSNSIASSLFGSRYKCTLGSCMRIGPFGYEGDFASSPECGRSKVSPPTEAPGTLVAIWVAPGCSWSASSLMVKVFAARFDSLSRDAPTTRGGFLSPNVMPPPGPKPGVINIWGVEIECFKLLRCSMVGTLGELSIPNDRGCWFAAPVFRLSKLGFFLPFNVGGLMKEGDEGSEDWNPSTLELRLSARLLGFLGFRGWGEVIGRSSLSGSRMGSLSTTFRAWNESIPKVPPGKDDSGRRVMGDSGDELGEGSEREDESTVDMVVVGEESVESDACVDVLCRCWWEWMGACERPFAGREG